MNGVPAGVGGWLAILAPEEREALEDWAHTVRYPKGARPLQEGGRATG